MNFSRQEQRTLQVLTKTNPHTAVVHLAALQPLYFAPVKACGSAHPPFSKTHTQPYCINTTGLNIIPAQLDNQ